MMSKEAMPTIRPALLSDIAALGALRLALWPDYDLAELESLAEGVLSGSGRDGAIFVACASSGALVGFSEGALRTDYVNGCETSPMAFLEGLYVAPGYRRQGLARALVEAVEAWGRNRGCAELGSDVLLDNIDSQRMHGAVGFEETERVVYFKKRL